MSVRRTAVPRRRNPAAAAPPSRAARIRGQARATRRAGAKGGDAGAAALAFLAESRRRLRREYLPKIRRVTRGLPVRDLWWRPNAHSNSIGNLMLHLDGNVRQWIVAGVGGVPDTRDRDAEFLAKTGGDSRALLAQLDRTLVEADRVLGRLRPQDLLERRDIQGYRVTVLQAVYHAVEHFSGHTGQILYAAKWRLDRDLGLYAHLDGPQRRARRRAGTPRKTRFF